ncbi:hypothetical protein [Natronococcus amylolyticus]|nr:hypothetical protein [Natronococcus amylolyticus]
MGVAIGAAPQDRTGLDVGNGSSALASSTVVSRPAALSPSLSGRVR